MNFSSKTLNSILFLLVIISIIILTGIQQKLYEGFFKGVRKRSKARKKREEKEKACKARGYASCADEERALNPNFEEEEEEEKKKKFGFFKGIGRRVGRKGEFTPRRSGGGIVGTGGFNPFGGRKKKNEEKACRDRGYDNCADEERALAMQTNISTFEEEKHANIEQKLHRLQNDDDFYKVDFSKCKPEHEQYNKTAKMYEKEKDNLKRKEERLTNLKIKSNIEKDATTSGRSIRAGILEKRIIEKEVQIEVSREVITKLEVQLLSISTLTENPYCFKLSALNDGF